MEPVTQAGRRRDFVRPLSSTRVSKCTATAPAQERRDPQPGSASSHGPAPATQDVEPPQPRRGDLDRASTRTTRKGRGHEDQYHERRRTREVARQREREIGDRRRQAVSEEEEAAHNWLQHAVNGNMSRPFHSVGSYVYGNRPCNYDGQTIKSMRVVGKFVCPDCRVVLAGPGMREHPRMQQYSEPEDDDCEAFRMPAERAQPAPDPADVGETAAREEQQEPLTVAPVAPEETAVRQPAQASKPVPATEVKPERVPTRQAGPAPDGKAEPKPWLRISRKSRPENLPPPISPNQAQPRYHGDEPREFVDDEDLVIKDSQIVLDGRRLKELDAVRFAAERGMTYVGMETRRIAYDGEKRVVINRNVRESRQDLVVQRVVLAQYTPAFIPFVVAMLYAIYPLYQFLLPVCLEFDLFRARPMTVAACTSFAVVVGLIIRIRPLCTTSLRCHLWMSVICMVLSYDWRFRFAMYWASAAYIWLPFLLWFTVRGPDARFVRFGVHWHVRWRALAVFLGLSVLRCGLPTDAVCCFGTLLLVVSAARLRWATYVALDEFLFPLNQRSVWYVPHAASCALAEYANGTGVEAARASCRQKLLRLATLPIPDAMHVALVSGTEEFVLQLVEGEPFFEDGETFMTSPLR